jgi:hypothetical protein
MPPFRGSPARIRALRYLCIAIAPLAGCSLVRRPAPVIDRSQDGRIQREVQARMTGEPSIDAGNVRVSVDGGIVALHGSVKGIGAWQCAISTSELVRGVRSVADYLVIERGPRDVRCVSPRPDTAVIIGRE